MSMTVNLKPRLRTPESRKQAEKDAKDTKPTDIMGRCREAYQILLREFEKRPK
jgi:hypothetical protein